MSDKFLMNRLANCHNPYQGRSKKVLCVCSAGLLRSPTAAYVLSQEPFNYNTRAAGIAKEFALIPVDRVLLDWADEIVCMDQFQKSTLTVMHKVDCEGLETPVLCLDIDDNYAYKDPKLIQQISQRYLERSEKINEEGENL